MINIKKIWEERKTEIIGGAIIVGTAATAVLLTRGYYKGKFNLVPKNLAMITFKPNPTLIPLEEAKAALDLAVDEKTAIAVVKDVTGYAAIQLKVV